MKVTIYLPKASEAGGFKQRIPNGKTMIPVYNAPFIYAGGWGNKGSGQSYVDAGFQMSTGNDANDAKNQWGLFVKASGVAYQDELYSQLGQVSDTYRFAGGSTVDLTFFNLSDLLIATAKEQGSNRSRVIALRLANDSRWSGNGVGNWYKMMTTIGQGRVRPNAPLQKLDSVGFLKNAAIKNMEIGYIDWGVLDKILRREIPEGEANVFERDNVTIEPRVGNGSNDQRKNFMQQGEYTDCKFPDDRAANDFGFDVTGNTNLIYNKAVQVVKTSDGELTSIDLRTPTSLQVAEDKLPVSKSAWIPAIPNQTDQPLPSATPDITVKLKGKPKASGSIVKTLFFQNYGSLNSLLEFRAYPIGQVDTDTNLQKALARKGQTGIVLWGNKSTNANELEEIAALSQLATKPPKSPWADSLYTARSTVNLRRPNNTRMTRGVDQAKLEIEATCPEKPESTPYKARFPVVYSTGLADDGVTPSTPANQKFSTVDDEPQKRVMWVNLELECIVPAKIAINPSPITLTGTVGSSTNTENLTISNIGDVDSTLEFKRFFVTENILDSSLLNPVPITGAALRPQAVVVPPNPVSGLIRDYRFALESADGTLTMTQAAKDKNEPPSSAVDVNFFCSSSGSFTRYINIVYKTGATTDTGEPILENAVVNVYVTCLSKPLPRPQAYARVRFIQSPMMTAFIGQTASNYVRVSNVGEADSLLEWRVAALTKSPMISPSDTPDLEPRASGSGSGALLLGQLVDTLISFQCDADGAFAVYVNVIVKEYNLMGVLEEKVISVLMRFYCEGEAKIEVTPLSLELKTPVKTSITKFITIRNVGTAKLEVSAEVTNGDWVDVTSVPSGLIEPGGSDVVAVTGRCPEYSSSPFSLETTLKIISNDSEKPIVSVPVSFECQGGEVVLSPRTLELKGDYYVHKVSPETTAKLFVSNFGAGPLESYLSFPDILRHIFILEGGGRYNDAIIKSRDYIVDAGGATQMKISATCEYAGVYYEDTAYLRSNDKDSDDAYIPIKLTLKCGGERFGVSKLVQSSGSSGCYYSWISYTGTGMSTIEYADGCITLAGVAAKFKLNGGEWRDDPVTGGSIYFILDVDAFIAGRN
jgi:hypothetical protein